MYCNHQDLERRFQVPIDVKSGKETQFGTVYACKNCGLSLVHPLPDATVVPSHYDLPAYYTHGEGHIPPVQPSLVERIITHLAWRTDKGGSLDPADLFDDQVLSGDVLDIGCGAGNLLSKFSDLGLNTFGIDPDETALAEANKRGHDVLLGTAEMVPPEFADKKFDVITMTHVLEHCLDPLQALENASKLLAKNGLFYCEVPNAGSAYFQTYGQISEMLDVPRHLYFFRKVDLANLAAAAGFEIVGWKFRGLTRHFDASWKSWENSIFDRLSEAGVTPSCARRSVIGDLKLLGKSVALAPERRYDCIGFVARRNAN